MTSAEERGLAGYLDAVAAGTPAPGGGSVAAVAGAMAAALGEMVANLTLGRARYASAEGELQPARERLTALRAELLAAAAADEVAYAAYRQAASLPKTTPDEVAARDEAMEAALIGASEVPLAVAHAAAEVATLLETAARLGNPHVRSDAALGALLARTAIDGALLNVRGNAAMLRDRARAAAFLDEAAVSEARGHAAANRTLALATESA